MGELNVIGKSVPRKDAAEKATGKAVYGVDVVLPGMLCGRILRSPHAHARIKKIDTSRAKVLQGVKVVITAEEAGAKCYGFFEHVHEKFADKHILAVHKVRFVGEEVAAVAAVDEDIAEAALRLIDVEYEVLPSVHDPLKAEGPGAPVIHEDFNNNIQHNVVIFNGDVEAGFASAYKIFENTYRVQPVSPSAMEPHQCVAEYNGGRLTVWSSTQMPFFLRQHLAEVLGLKEKQIRILKTTTGGRFGSGMDMHALDPICCLLAQRTRRPVKIIYNREEEFLSARIRHPARLTFKTGVSKEGKLLSIDVKCTLDNGAYSSMGLGVASVLGQNAMSLYRVPNMRYEAKIVYTNNPYGGAFRGYGNPQGTFAMERQMDIMAKGLGMDLLEFRKINGNRPGDETILGQKITSCGFVDCIDAAARAIEFHKVRPDYHGVGLTDLFHVGGGARVHGNNDGCGAYVKIEDDASVSVIVGGQEIGQGYVTVMAQIAAEVLGVTYDDVKVFNTDTDVMPFDIGSHGSRSTFVGGNAVKLASLDAREKLLKYGAEFFEARPEDLEMADGKIWVKGSPARNASIADIVRSGKYRRKGEQILGTGYYDPPSEEPDRQGRGNKSGAYAFGAQAVEVSVDPETGEVTILRMVAAHDIGKALNPRALEGQIEGSLAQGLGYALTEEMVFSENGKVLNPNFRDYLLPTAPDMPPLVPILVETNDPEGPFGAKGIGECGLVPTAPAIVNAICNAIGAELFELPVTPGKILEALAKKQQGGRSDDR